VCREKVVFSGAHKSAAPILATVLETHVMNHLDSFMDSVEAWIADRLAERNGERKQRERSLDNERRVLAELKTRRRQQLDGFDGIDLTDEQRKITLEVIEDTDGKIDAQAHRIAEAQAVLAEWGTTPAVDDALDFYNSLLDVIQGRVKAAHGPRELNEALAGILVGMWCEAADGLLLVEFELQAQPAKRLTLPVTEAENDVGLLGAVKVVEAMDSKPSDSDQPVETPVEIPAVSQTAQQTFISGRLWERPPFTRHEGGVPIPPLVVQVGA
jgi:hypothetical protein